MSGDDSLVIPETKVPIVKLAEGQAILVYAKAKMGNAQKHTKWQCVVAPRFYQAPSISVSSGKSSKAIFDIVDKKKFKKKGSIKTDFQGEEFRFFKKLPSRVPAHHKKMILDARRIL